VSSVASVAEHYDGHLGPVYRWMVGDIMAAMERSRAELHAVGIVPGATGLAIDLGAGLGLHAIPLARLGFEVVAIETSSPMAEELRRETGDLPVRAVEGDLRRFREYVSGLADVIACMGDTLTHLPSQEAVAQVLDDVAATLASPGVFVATFRDYTRAGPAGTARFIPVRSDEARILTCFLEYGEGTVTVHDLLHERTDAGWQLRASSYPKLRLDPAWVVGRLEAVGLSARQEAGPGGMVRIVARLA
jgi:SAM-dependent methyltransferase